MATYENELWDLADELDAIATLDPAEIVIELGKLANRNNPHAIEVRLKKIRALAVAEVVEKYGGRQTRGAQAKAAREMGISEWAVGRLLIGSSSRPAEPGSQT